jgi:methionyl-tRNA synthetase
MNKTVYITTSIPYVNAKPHIGYALEAVQTDSFVRFHKQLGDKTYFLSGTDENAIKNVESAEKLGITTQELVDQNAQAFLDLKEALALSFDQFIRTSSKKHIEGAQRFWKKCEKDIYKKTYEGLYCTGCETFYKDGEFKDNICPHHNRPLEVVKEVNYFFKLSNYQKQVRELIETNTLELLPGFRKEELLNFIDSGIEDISVSRPKERTKGWGIPVPGDDSQHMYVWFDALTNYVTALDYDEGELYKTYWTENENRFHVIGKDIVKFHALYWPAMLLSAGAPSPKRIYAHGFITVDGKKMSKTIGNVVDPFDLVKEYGVDAVRYYLLREIPSLDDGDFSHHRMKQIYENDLANELGNSVSRITTLAEKDGITISTAPTVQFNEETVKRMEAFDFNHVLETIGNDVKELNKSINDSAPWKQEASERKEFLTQSLTKLYEIGWKLKPFLPETGEKITQATVGTICKITPLFPKK